MSTQRLTFLYPHLFRTARLGESASNAGRCRPLRPAPATPSSPAEHRCQHHAAPFGTSTVSSKASFAPRVGKGIEPKPLGKVQAAPALESHMKDAPSAPPPGTPDETSPEERKKVAKALDPAADALNATLSSPGVSSEEKAAAEAAAASAPGATAAPAAAAAAASSTNTSPNNAEDGDGAAPPKKKRATGPMDAVLHMEPPENVPANEKPPHLKPPPYVHHFDSYSLVKQLEEGGYTNAQAITAMKAVRALLAQNLEVAQGGLISKSDVENETYLFRAACAELSTEVKNNRRIADEALRQQRTMLQHEVDNTTQMLNQELLTLNDNVRGMFNDRKMAVREEQKAAESAIQQIAYKITVILNSDSRSEIEAVRWVVARRAVLGLVFMVAVSLATLRYSTYVSHASEKEAQREKEEHEALRKSGGKIDGAMGPDAAEILAAN
ncbi:hypothetical protein N0V82_005726 [Gnomoniopsis sp. IMI 355080]|nr:hypothetical protein N0V82_005726 [Gnomoniopsis sp. IMI 355080]